MSNEKKLDHIVVLGDAACGKSVFCNACNKVFDNTPFQETYQPTIKADFKLLNVHNKNIILWDTADQEKDKAFAESSKKLANAYIVMFDLTRLESFKHAKKEILSLQEEYEKENKKIPIILVGAKSDLIDKIVVTTEMINEFNSDSKYPYFQTSAKNKTNVDAVLNKAIELACNSNDLDNKDFENSEDFEDVENFTAPENKKSWNPFSDTYYYARDFLKHARVIQTPLYQKFRDAFYVFFGRDNFGQEMHDSNFRRHAGLLDYLIIFPLINRIFTGLIDKAKTIENKRLQFLAKLFIAILVGIPYVALNLVKAAVSLALVIATAPVTLAVGFITFCMRKYHEKKAKSMKVKTVPALKGEVSTTQVSTTQSLLEFMNAKDVKNYHEISAFSYRVEFSIQGNQSALRSLSILAVDNVTMNDEDLKDALSLKK